MGKNWSNKVRSFNKQKILIEKRTEKYEITKQFGSFRKIYPNPHRFCIEF